MLERILIQNLDSLGLDQRFRGKLYGDRAARNSEKLAADDRNKIKADIFSVIEIINSRSTSL